MSGSKQKALILVCPLNLLLVRLLSLDKSFTFGVLAAVASGLMVIFLTYTGYAASKFSFLTLVFFLTRLS